MEVRRAKPGLLLTRVFSRPKTLVPFLARLNLDAMSVPELSFTAFESWRASCRSSASVAQIIAAASIEVMDALFGFVVRNDAEWSR